MSDQDRISHKSHTPDHAEYLGPFPEAQYFDPDHMSPAKKKEFETWYDIERGRTPVYDLKRELIEYCGSDVKLLKAGCQKFVGEFRTVAGFDPIEKCVTIAQACNRYWRKRVMEEDSIALEPSNGWHGARLPHSKKSLHWLMWESHQRGVRIQHARNGGEKIIRIPEHPRPYHVDGYTISSRKVMRDYQFI